MCTCGESLRDQIQIHVSHKSLLTINNNLKIQLHTLYPVDFYIIKYNIIEKNI